MTCSIPDCDGKVKARGFCQLHYHRWRRTGDPLQVAERHPRGICAVDGCERVTKALGLCQAHYQRQWAAEKRADADYKPVPEVREYIQHPSLPPGAQRVLCGDCAAVLAVVWSDDAVRAALDHHTCPPRGETK